MNFWCGSTSGPSTRCATCSRAIRPKSTTCFRKSSSGFGTASTTTRDAAPRRLGSIASRYKKERRRIETVPLTVDIDPYEADDPKTQQIRELYDRISRLDLIDRSLILLWLEGISYDEIGAIIGITPNNVGVRLARIKEKLVKMSKNE